ncbi:MAG: prepilin-type N-terminal cleavage/methylation domain-containing protein [Phycisphaerae bacterium]|nr:prepilin-type N-terminal cleavage/methylation domain-containing protein [Planctomycetota bacterium]MBL7218664.1 prepilin-type N-terminal cleavage/methylation domain-containing protein [Phycisphaerae bacterium]
MRRGAFTLIELLVVVVLIALLAVLLIPSFTPVMSIYRATQCRNNLNRLWQGFVLASDTATSGEGVLSTGAKDSAGLYPTGLMWPSVPNNVVTELELFQCPEDEVKQSSVSGSLVTVEYVSPNGHYPLDTIGDGNCYKSRRGRNSQGPYTEYMMQDDTNSNGQYALMNFNGWVDSDGSGRIYDSGRIYIFKDLREDTVGCVPAWGPNHGPGWPDRINTCPNMNQIWYNGEPSLTGNGRMQDARGQSFTLANWGERLTNYGINTYAFQYSTGGGCIVLVDYQESMVDVDIPLESEGLLLQSARHFDKVNYLLSDGSVKTATPLEISPRLHPKAWRP